jgi:hypothetical protein
VQARCPKYPLVPPRVVAIATDKYLKPTTPFTDPSNLYGVLAPHYGQDIGMSVGRSAPGTQNVGASVAELKKKMRKLLTIFAGGDKSGMAKRLSACVLGLVLCPYVYIAVGGLSGFGPAFTFVSLPLLIPSTGFLLFRFISPPGRRSRARMALLLEFLCWSVVAAFVAIISGFTLLTTFERIGLTTIFFLIASAGSFPIVHLRATAIRQRMQEVPPPIASAVMLVILTVAGSIGVVYLLAAPRFI